MSVWPTRTAFPPQGIGWAPTNRTKTVLTITNLTFKEALRRRTPIISLLIAALLIVGAFVPLTGRLLLLPPPVANRIYTSFYVSLSTDILKFFASVFAIALSAGAISAELERGVLSSILPKPISRLSVYVGKWLGLVLFVAINVLVWDGIIWGVATYRAPHLSHAGVWHALPYVMLYPVVFVTLGLLFSTFAAFPLAAGLSILFTGVGWASGILYILHQVFDIAVLLRLSRLADYLMPIGRMARWVQKGLGPLPIFGNADLNNTGRFREIAAVPADLAYIGLYVAFCFILGAIIIGRRDV